MTITKTNGSKTVEKVTINLKKIVFLAFIILCLNGASKLYAQDTKTRQEERTEKRANKDQRKIDRDKSKLDRKEMKMQKKERKMNRMQRKADEK